ncbi:MAG: hypothetical protein HYR66_18420 [Sphingobacteriales bacterium]|nr:hypothetical protein [Sphingobacteriales bacterium]MBI3720421.1 hypothetical protein [Sphingobacteriales bacterium]
MKKLISILTILIFLASCRKEDSFSFEPDQHNKLDSTWVNAISDQSKVCELVKNFSTIQPVTDTTELFLNDTTFIREDNYDIIIPPGTLKGSSTSAITGKISYNFILTEKLGDYIRLQQSTINSSQYLLSTGGSFYLRFFRGTEELNLIDGKYIVVRYNEPQPRQNMKVFYGAGDLSYPVPVNVSNGWTLSSANCYVKPVARKVNTTYYYAYEVSTDRLKWINIASNLTQGTSLVSLSVYLPDLFSNANTQAYIVFKDTKTIVKLSGDAGSRKFVVLNIPAGAHASIVTISKTAEDYFMAVQDVITSDKPIQVKPDKVNLDQIINFINTL